MTAEQLEASRAERLRQNGHGTITYEDARTWIEETGFCLFLPRRQFASAITPTFIEAVTGQRNATPDPKQIALAEQLLVRLENDGIVVRLNLQGQPGEQPDFIVASWVLPYVYALRGDRDWRRSPQLTGSRQVSPLAVQTYKILEAGDANVSSLRQTLGREVTEAAVLRAIAELWQQLRILPTIAAPGHPAKWQLLRTRFQKAIAEGASTSQVTAISVLASIYLQAVIAATMEDVEIFLSPLTARSKVREVLRGLVATRQVHTIALGHAPHFYVAGTLPEFATTPTYYASSAMASSYFFSGDREEEAPETVFHEPPEAPAPLEKNTEAPAAKPEAPVHPTAAAPSKPLVATPAPRRPTSKPSARPHLSRPATHTRDRKPTQAASRPAPRHGSENRSASSRPSRPGASRTAGAHGHAASNRWSSSSPKRTEGKPASAHASATHAKSKPVARPAKPLAGGHGAKPVLNPHKTGKPASKSTSSRGTVAKHGGSLGRPTHKPTARPGAKASASKRFGYAAASRTGAKKRG